MPVNLSIKNTPEKIVRKLKHTEAAERRRSITLTELVARVASLVLSQ